MVATKNYEDSGVLAVEDCGNEFQFNFVHTVATVVGDVNNGRY